MFPYRGKSASTALEYFDEHKEYQTNKAKSEIELSAEVAGMTYDQYINAVVQHSEGMSSEQDVIDKMISLIRNSYVSSNTYSECDDWSIPQANSEGKSNRLVSSGLVLSHGNILPDYLEDDERTSVSHDAMNAYKQEILNGHGINLAYYADTEGKYVASDEQKGEDYAQYCNKVLDGDHCVCVVGWDDNYSKDNFRDGCRPPEDGAWIIKNSWGSESDAGPDDLGNIVNKNSYGAKNSDGKCTGYFYLSYYDRTIYSGETMEFSSNLAGKNAFGVMQYDYLPASAGLISII